MISLPHLCYLHDIDQLMKFKTGLVALNVGNILTGSTSLAKGTLKTVTKTSGNWGSDAAGTVVLSHVTGIFIDGEVILDDHAAPAGSAKADGTNENNVDKNGKVPPGSSVASTTATPCRFVEARGGGGDQKYNWSGSFPSVLLPAYLSIDKASEGILEITSTEDGFVGTFIVEKVHRWRGFGVHHITCELKENT